MDPALIIAAINAAIQLINLAIKAAANAKQSGEWTPEDEVAFTAKIEQLKQQPWWQPET